MRTRDAIRKALLLALLVPLLLEGLAWTRAMCTELLQSSYPNVGIGANDAPITWRIFDRIVVGDFREFRVEILDAERRVVTEGPALQPIEEWGYPPVIRGWSALVGRDAPWERFEDPPFVVESMEMGLQLDPTRRTGLLDGLEFVQNGGTRYLSRNGRWHPMSGNFWRLEDGHFLCRSAPDGEVVAGFGPDGYRIGVDAAQGERFGDLVIIAIEHSGRQGQPDYRVRQVMLDRDRFTIVDLTIHGLPAAEDTIARWKQPAPVDVAVHPIREVEGASADTRDRLDLLLETDDERLLVALDGRILSRAPRPRDETPLQAAPVRMLLNGAPGVVSSAGGTQPDADVAPWAVVEAIPIPVDPVVERHRFHLLRAGEPARAIETTLEPVTVGEHLAAATVLLPDLVLPLPLAAASAASDAPRTWKELNRWWWRSPALAEGRRPGLLALVLLVAGLCAVLARRSARVRCARGGAVRAWTVAVFLLGPLGLLWMRLCLPRVRIEAVADGRRAANLDTAPAGRTPWPEPAPLGIEVLGGRDS